MNHETLHAYFDGELTPLECEQVERALAKDPALAESYSHLLALDSALESAWVDVVSDGLASGGLASDGMAPPTDSQTREWARTIVAGERRARRGRLIALTTAAAGIAAALLLAFPPAVSPQTGDDGFFTVDEEAGYVYWENDGDTYGTGDLADLEDQILDVLGAT